MTQIKWKLSGAGDDFGLKEDEKTSCQHYATVDGSRIMVFDNGNKTKKTQIRSYHLDTESKTVSSVDDLCVEGRFSSACGDVQHLYDDTYVIGWGRTENDAVCMSVYDFSADKELLSVTLENPKNFTYRCVYYD